MLWRSSSREPDLVRFSNQGGYDAVSFIDRASASGGLPIFSTLFALLATVACLSRGSGRLSRYCSSEYFTSL